MVTGFDKRIDMLIKILQEKISEYQRMAKTLRGKKSIDFAKKFETAIKTIEGEILLIDLVKKMYIFFEKQSRDEDDESTAKDLKIILATQGEALGLAKSTHKAVNPTFWDKAKNQSWGIFIGILIGLATTLLLKVAGL